MDLHVFRKFILKQIAGEVNYSEVDHRFRVCVRPVTASTRSTIITEGARWGLSESFADNYLNQVLSNISTLFAPHERSLQDIDLNDLKQGDMILLSGTDKEGREMIKLMYLGRTSKTNNHRMMVLSSTRLSLHQDDIVEPYNNTIIVTNTRIKFIVYRNARRIPDDNQIYLTCTLDNIIRIIPSEIHEVIDAQENFTFNEYQAKNESIESKDVLSLGRNAMSLLLHNFSSKMTAYADFIDEETAYFSSNEILIYKPSELRNILFGVPDEFKQCDCKINTLEKGTIYKDSEGKLYIRKAAKTKCISV